MEEQYIENTLTLEVFKARLVGGGPAHGKGVEFGGL